VSKSLRKLKTGRPLRHKREERKLILEIFEDGVKYWTVKTTTMTWKLIMKSVQTNLQDHLIYVKKLSQIWSIKVEKITKNCDAVII
jgi:hypothetical protein